MWLEDFILKQADQRLRRYRLAAEELKKELAEEYSKYLPGIKSACQEAVYWHGTGKYRYHDATQHQQDGVAQTVDILASISNDDGLKPHLDPWINSGGETVSMGTTRMHSRIFARVHLQEGKSLLYELGGMRFWIRLYGAFLSCWSLASYEDFCQSVKSVSRLLSGNDLSSRVSAIRKLGRNRGITLAAVYTGRILESDISGNYPMLFGIKGENLSVIDTMPLTHKVEARSLQPVRISNFSHLEVPLDKISETNALLQSKGVDLKVLPLEFVDLYMSNIPIKELSLGIR